MDDRTELAYLTEAAREVIAGCRAIAHDGTVLYLPDGKANYRALWTRDFAYMVENAGDLMPTEDVEACIRYLLRGQRDDGVIPDRVRLDGVPVYVAGSEIRPLGEPNLDNAQFLVIAVDEHLRRLPGDRASALFHEWAAPLAKGIDYIPLSTRGLVYNDPDTPHSPYGFTDTVGKTGELLMESLLYWTACRRLAHWHRQIGGEAQAEDYESRTRLVEGNVAVLWDDTVGAFLAATEDCRQIDVWGSAYAIYLDLPLGRKRESLPRFLVKSYDRYAWHGQIRHLLKPERWERLLRPVEPETYQNGAYWATASGWVVWALDQADPRLARQTLRGLVDDFRQSGICECVNEGYRKLEGYVVSATNPLGAARRLYQTTLP